MVRRPKGALKIFLEHSFDEPNINESRGAGIIFSVN